VGPTASGKTSLSIYLAQKLKGEVVSADSRQVYKGLDIGTGKVTKKEMAGIPHHLLDVASPKKEFSVNDFVRLGEKACSSILQNNGTPIVVGGTGYYVDALLGRIVLPNVPPNPKLRTQLEKKTPLQLFAQLKKLDPRRAKTIEPHHKRRLIRAIEIAVALGKSPVPNTNEKYRVLWLGIAPTKEVLHKNIHKRLLARMKIGMVTEAKRLHKQDLSYKRMHALGLEYRSLANYLQGSVTKDEMLTELERAIQKYAKRQMQWFKRNQNICWVKNKTEALRLAKEFTISSGR
jgi:tRNA dimethylallyltransferase